MDKLLDILKSEIVKGDEYHSISEVESYIFELCELYEIKEMFLETSTKFFCEGNLEYGVRAIKQARQCEIDIINKIKKFEAIYE